MRLPKQIKAKRITLKHPAKPTFKLAEGLYAIADKYRETLDEWLSWVYKTHSPEDEFTFYLVNWSQKNWEEGTGFAYVIYQKGTNKILGTIDLFHVSDENKSGEIGYWLADDAVGHGYMQEAVRTLETEAFKAGLNRIVIGNDTQNIRSAHVAERCGYILEGVMRQDAWDGYHKRFRNCNIWSKLKSDWEKEK
jgi:RimJ/RimL family protein N-acetyltransferase